MSDTEDIQNGDTVTTKKGRGRPKKSATSPTKKSPPVKKRKVAAEVTQRRTSG